MQVNLQIIRNWRNRLSNLSLGEWVDGRTHNYCVEDAFTLFILNELVNKLNLPLKKAFSILDPLLIYEISKVFAQLDDVDSGVEPLPQNQIKNLVYRVIFNNNGETANIYKLELSAGNSQQYRSLVSSELTDPKEISRLSIEIDLQLYLDYFIYKLSQIEQLIGLADQVKDSLARASNQ